MAWSQSLIARLRISAGPGAERGLLQLHPLRGDLLTLYSGQITTTYRARSSCASRAFPTASTLRRCFALYSTNYVASESSRECAFYTYRDWTAWRKPLGRFRWC